MSLRLPDTTREPPAAAPDADEAINSWLDLLEGALRMPQHRAREIRDELEDHLRARVNDRLLAGESEYTAIRRAVAELGEATSLAQHLQRAQKAPIRRYIMHASIISISAAALGLSIAAYTGVGAPPSVYRGSTYAFAPGADDARITTEPSWTFGQFADAFARATSLSAFVHWRSLEELGIDPDGDWLLDVAVQDASPETLLRLVNERIDMPEGIAVHAAEGRLEFATQRYIDELTTRLARYDIAPVIRVHADESRRAVEVRDEIAELIRSCVETDTWIDRGGDRASIQAIGDLLFIQAPERYFPKIEWVLAELATGDRAAPVQVDQDPQVRVYPLQDVPAGSATDQLIRLLSVSFEDEWESLSASTSIQVDERSNALIARAPARVHERLGPYLALLDLADGMPRVISTIRSDPDAIALDVTYAVPHASPSSP